MAAQKYLITLLSIIVGIHVQGLHREMKTESWPNCDHYKKSCSIAQRKGLNVVYSKASHSSNDTLHYAFSTVGAPTIVYARTTGNNSDVIMYFDWNKIVNNGSLKGSITFNNSDSSGYRVDYIFGVAFTKLIEYDDTNDTSNIETCDKNNGSFNIMTFENVTWQAVEKNVKNNAFVFNASGEKNDQFSNGSVTFSFSVQGDDGRGSGLPRLKFNANVTQFDFQIDGVAPLYKHSRFALEATLCSLSPNKDMLIDQTETIDDEYAPGVFLITDWLSNPEKQNVAGFMQWKPVAYLGKDRGTKVVTKVNHYDIASRNETYFLDKTLVYGLFGDSLWNESEVICRTSNISFGQPKDKFYLKHNYTVWTVAVGYGTPPKDEISSTVIIIISAGLGIPVIVMIFGGLFTIVRKCRGLSQQYTTNGGNNSIK